MAKSVMLARRPLSGPGLPFTTGDDELLVYLKGKLSWKWREIAKYFPGRSQGAVQTRYSKYLARPTSVMATTSKSSQTCNGGIERSTSEPVSNSGSSRPVTDAIFTNNQGSRVPDGISNNPESRTLDLVIDPGDEEDPVACDGNSSNIDIELGLDSSNNRKYSGQVDNSDGASGIEAARDSSTSESRQSSVITTISQSSKTSLSSPTQPADPDYEEIVRPTKRQRTSVKDKQATVYKLPYPAIQGGLSTRSDIQTVPGYRNEIISPEMQMTGNSQAATPELALEERVEERVLRTKPWSVAPVAQMMLDVPAIQQPAATGCKDYRTIAAGWKIVDQGKFEDDLCLAIPRICLPLTLQVFASLVRQLHRIEQAHLVKDVLAMLRSLPALSRTWPPPKAPEARAAAPEPFPVDLVRKDMSELIVEIQRDKDTKRKIDSLVEITVFRLETLKAIRDDPNRDLFNDKSWQDLLLAVEKYIETMNPMPDKMMTEWHRVNAEIESKQGRIRAMEMNLEEIKKANEDHIREMRNRLDRHFQLLQRMDVGGEAES